MSDLTKYLTKLNVDELLWELAISKNQEHILLLAEIRRRLLAAENPLTKEWTLPKITSADVIALGRAENPVGYDPPTECAARWRVGSKVPVNLYKDGVIAGQMQSPELAAEVVSALAQPCRAAMTQEEAIAIATDICSYTEEIEGVRRVYSLLESLGWLIPKIAEALIAASKGEK